MLLLTQPRIRRIANIISIDTIGIKNVNVIGHIKQKIPQVRDFFAPSAGLEYRSYGNPLINPASAGL